MYSYSLVFLCTFSTKILNLLITSCQKLKKIIKLLTSNLDKMVNGTKNLDMMLGGQRPYPDKTSLDYVEIRAEESIKKALYKKPSWLLLF